MLDIYLTLGNEKTINVVKYYTFMQLLGDFGGFTEAVDILLSFIGLYCSQQFFKVDFVSKFFVKKK